MAGTQGGSAMSASGVEQMLTGLLEASHHMALERIPGLVGEHVPCAGLGEVLIYVVDLQQSVLRLLQGHAGNGGEISELRVDTTLAGRAFQEVRILCKPGDGDGPDRWWVPLLDGTERLGVLCISASSADERTVENMRHLASLVALMVVSKRAYSDPYARLVRSRPMNVAAEMQWNLMPPLTFADEHIVIAGVVEPAYEIGGDAFDYAIDGDTACLALFDAMGHDVRAGLTANLAVAAGRNSRRQGVDDLRAASEAIERVLLEEFGRRTRFVTGVLARLDRHTGVFSWVNRGHHPPVVIRGGRWVSVLRCPPAHPMGLDLGLPVMLCQEQLEPGDRVLLYSDGITEARNHHGHEFGLERFADFIIRAAADALPVPETLRRLIRNVLNYHDGRLQDDATVLLAEWHGTGDGSLTV
jgi:hypothetical protein